ncbi:oxysterol-binding protein 1, partial [Paragonimus westermani]
SCSEFTTLGRSQIQRWKRAFNSQRERCALLEQMIEELAKQLRQLEMMVKQNNPQASLALAGLNTSGPAVGTNLPSHVHSHPASVPGQAIRVDKTHVLASGNKQLSLQTAISMSSSTPAVSKSSPNELQVNRIPSPTVSVSLSPSHKEKTIVNADNWIASKFTHIPNVESSDEDFFDAEDGSSEFSVYLPASQLKTSVADGSSKTDDFQTDGSSGLLLDTSNGKWNDGLREDDSTIPTSSEVAFEYESDVDLTEEDYYIHGNKSPKSKGLREARVIPARLRRRETQSTTDGQRTDKMKVEEVSDKQHSTMDVYVPRRKSLLTRRTAIPPKPNYSLNLWSIMKNCIGKELTKIPMPVNFSEPLSMLQRLAEDFEYSSLLDRAAACQDSLEQMVHVAAFTVSSYATTAVRVNKPFNPLLGETYECDRTDDLGWRYLAEQVSHHPPKCAVHCESNAWYCWFEFSMNTKFRGKYLQINPVGTVHLVFRKSGYHYTWQKIPLTVHNIIVGRLWIDNSGEMDIVNLKTGEKCHLSYKAYSYFSSETPRRVTGAVTNRSGDVRYVLNGTWDESMEYATVVSSRTTRNGKPVLETGPSRLIWQKTPLPADADKMYFFTTLALQLNEEEEGVSPTDCRARPDQRLMELGRWDEANREKVVLEEKQRHRRRQAAIQLATDSLNQTARTSDSTNSSGHKNLESLSETSDSNPSLSKSALTPTLISSFLDHVDNAHRPLWFDLKRDEDTGVMIFLFNGKYWDCKSKSDWSVCPDIY